jgi:hypothetical protein
MQLRGGMNRAIKRELDGLNAPTRSERIGSAFGRAIGSAIRAPVPAIGAAASLASGSSLLTSGGSDVLPEQSGCDAARVEVR